MLRLAGIVPRRGISPRLSTFLHVVRSQARSYTQQKVSKDQSPVHFRHRRHSPSSLKNVYMPTHPMKKDNPPDESSPKHCQRSFLTIRLPNQYNNILPDLILFDIGSVEYIRSVDKSSSYLYYICALVLDTTTEKIKLLHTNACPVPSDDNDDAWTEVPDDETEFDAGVYLCRPLFELIRITAEKVLVGPEIELPDTPGEIFTIPQNVAKKRLNKMDSLANPDDPAEDDQQPTSKSGISPKKDRKEKAPVFTRSSAAKFRTDLMTMFERCVLTKKRSNICIASHLVPVHLITAAQSKGGVRLGEYKVTDPYDPRVGVLVGPDLDIHIDNFEAGFRIIDDNSIKFDIFPNQERSGKEYFTFSASVYSEKPVASMVKNLKFNEALAWHYKHCLISCWGGFYFQSYLKSFPTGDDVFAWQDGDYVSTDV